MTDRGKPQDAKHKGASDRSQAEQDADRTENNVRDEIAKQEETRG